MSGGLQLHPRYFKVREASNTITLSFLKIEERRKATMDKPIKAFLAIAAETIKATSLKKRKTPDGLDALGKEFLKELMLIEEKYELTQGESLKILLESASDMVKYVIRHERHPNDPDKKGDEA